MACEIVPMSLVIFFDGRDSERVCDDCLDAAIEDGGQVEGNGNPYGDDDCSRCGKAGTVEDETDEDEED